MPVPLNLEASYLPPKPRISNIGPYRLYDTRDRSLDRDLQYALDNGFDGVLCSPDALDQVRKHPFHALSVDRKGARARVSLVGFQRLRAVVCGDADLTGLHDLEYAGTGGHAILPDPAPRLVHLTLGVPEWRDLRGLNAPALRFMQVEGGRIRTLDGIQRSDQLQILDISGCNQLTDTSALAQVRSLLTVSFVNCKRVLPEGLVDSTVRELTLYRCGRIASLQFLERMPDLRVLNLSGTVVGDGDLTPILRHPGIEEVQLDRDGDEARSISRAIGARARTPIELNWRAGELQVTATCHCSILSARTLLGGLIPRDARARAAMEAAGVPRAADLLLPSVVLAPGVMVFEYAAEPGSPPHVAVVLDVASGAMRVEPAQSGGHRPAPGVGDPEDRTVPEVDVDLENADASVLEHWQGRLPALVAAARAALRDVPSKGATQYARHHLDELPVEDWRSAPGVDSAPTIAEFFEHLHPVALWGDPAECLHLDLSIGEDLTQYVLSFQILPDGTLGDSTMES